MVTSVQNFVADQYDLLHNFVKDATSPEQNCNLRDGLPNQNANSEDLLRSSAQQPMSQRSLDLRRSFLFPEGPNIAHRQQSRRIQTEPRFLDRFLQILDLTLRQLDLLLTNRIIDFPQVHQTLHLAR